jgi:hypothetical protein
MNAAEYGRTICALGPESFILATDLGQPNNPLNPDGMIAFVEATRKEGISLPDIADGQDQSRARWAWRGEDCAILPAWTF